jgi:hypothetical protein
MKAANGIGPVAYNYCESAYLRIGDVESYTVIASESCFARGVDHCLACLDDHLTEEEEPLYILLTTLRTVMGA